jgi:Cu(I)/Ag(I) efflux system membrane fusion protein
MKNLIKIFSLFAVAMLIGLGLGYFIFGNKKVEHSHQDSNAGQTASEWTCSMHPQIRSEEPGLCPICEMDLIPMDATKSDNPLVLEMTETAVKLSNIQTTRIGSGTSAGDEKLSLSGTIKADERRAFNQVAHVAGRIEQLFVTFEGERIRKGQKLAVLYSPELILAQKELIQAKRLVGQNPALLEAARKKLAYWMISKEKIKQLEDSEEIQERLTIYAERDGVVTNKKVDVGDHVHEGQILFDLVDLDQLWVVFDAYEEDLSDLNIGSVIEFTTAALPGRQLQTTIDFINPVIDAATRTATVRGVIANQRRQLKPEMFVKGQLQSKKSGNEMLYVPKTAVLWTGERSVVYVKLPDTTIPSFEYREVVLGESNGSHYEIIEGLFSGDEVVTNGSFSLDAAAQLNNQQSMMNRLVSLQESEEAAFQNFQSETPESFKRDIDKLVSAYLIVKDALVATDSDQAAAAAKTLKTKLEEVNAASLPDNVNTYWQEQLEGLQFHTQKIISSEDTEVQRVQFGFLSDLIIDAVLALGTYEQDLFVQHCPMAFDDQGADWLSAEEQIRNPYFGDKMLKCGLVEQDLKGAISLKESE